MPTFHDIRIASGLTNSLSRGSFAEFMERETGYTWDGTAEGKIALMQAYETKTQSEEGKEQREGSRYIFEVESRLLPILAEMEMKGVVLDTTKLAEIGERIRAGIKACEVEIFEVTGEFFNLNSPKQVAEILFGKLGIKPTKKNKTGYSVDTEVLEEIAKEYDVARLIIEHRTLSKLQSTYVESLLKVADKKTRRVHTTYGQLGAATGRMSSNDPNLQNIPTGIGYASEIKSCFIPSEGNIFSRSRLFPDRDPSPCLAFAGSISPRCIRAGWGYPCSYGEVPLSWREWDIEWTKTYCEDCWISEWSMGSRDLVLRKHSEHLHGKRRNISKHSMRNIHEWRTIMRLSSKMVVHSDMWRRLSVGDDISQASVMRIRWLSRSPKGKRSICRYRVQPQIC